MFDWKALVRTVAPTLATALGGPLAGMATRAIAGAVLGNEGADEGQIAAALQGASPETLLALKKADQDFAVKMRELDIDEIKLANDDRASARNREIRTKDKMPAIIALAALGGFFGILVAMAFVEIPASAVQPFSIMLGVLGTLVGGVTNYYFGSSAGSAAKNEMLERLKS
jgi:uncharacterized membrane protein YsdA (DUF1294 family)